MKLLIVRHAPAEDRQEFSRTGKPDTQRPLTKDGRDKMRRVSRALAALVPEVDVVATSPLIRTMQTARIVAAAYPDAEVVRLDSLAPDGSYEDTIRWLAKQAHMRCVSIIGHEPSLGSLLSAVLCGSPDGGLEFRKSGAALVAFQGKPGKGDARLEWLMTPVILRALARS